MVSQDATQSPHIHPAATNPPHPTAFTISPSEATQHAATSLAEHTRTGTARTTAEAIDRGWDDFPNGRFGDAKSPAFGVIDPWDGGGLGVPVRLSPNTCTTETNLALKAPRSDCSVGATYYSRRPHSPLPLVSK